MTVPEISPLERSIRGAYTNPPTAGPGLCTVCTAPTSGPEYAECFSCSQHIRSGHPLAAGGVVPLTWAPMSAPGNGYSGQGYLDLKQYKEPSGTDEQVQRLASLLVLEVNRHQSCLIPSSGAPYLLAHVPSTSGTRTGEHPIQRHFLSRFRQEVPRIVPEYIGPYGGGRNGRRELNPANWRIPVEGTEGINRVLIIDDTWVTGGHAQSVAGAFEAVGP